MLNLPELKPLITTNEATKPVRRQGRVWSGSASH